MSYPPHSLQFLSQADDHSAGKFHILFVFFVAVMFAISLISLLGYHIYLIIKNRSTIGEPVFIFSY